MKCLIWNFIKLHFYTVKLTPRKKFQLLQLWNFKRVCKLKNTGWHKKLKYRLHGRMVKRNRSWNYAVFPICVCVCVHKGIYAPPRCRAIGCKRNLQICTCSDLPVKRIITSFVVLMSSSFKNKKNFFDNNVN